MPATIRRPTISTQAPARLGEAPTSAAVPAWFVSNGSGGYQLATSGTPAAALRSNGAGGYVLTPGLTVSDALVAQVGSSFLIR